MLVIALTGGIACGKTTLSHALRTLGAPVLDADAFSRQVTAPQGAALPAIRARFGDAVFDPQGALDRRALGALVFEDRAARQDLEAIVHPLVDQAMQNGLEACARAGAEAVVLEIPLLFEAHMEHLADEIWVVYLPEALQMQRLMARDGLSRAQALARMASQLPMAEKLCRADIIFPMTGPRVQCAEMAHAQWARIIRKVADR